MKNKRFMRNKRGSISLFVLLSVLFFLVIVTAVATSAKNKESKINTEITKVKSAYEKDVGREQQVYLEKIKEIQVASQRELIVDPNGGEWGTALTKKTTIKQEEGTTYVLDDPTPPAVVLDTDGGELEGELKKITFEEWQLSGAGSLSGNTYTFGNENAILKARYSPDSIAIPGVTKAGYNFVRMV